MRVLKSLFFSVAFLLALSARLPAQDLPAAKPADVGFSAERLERITQWLRDDTAKGTIPGAVVMIVRNGKVAYFESIGMLDPQTKAPMRKDAIFRIHSMSKPITTVAVMMLYEQGKITLDEPIAKYIPAFKGMKVGVETKGEDGKPKLELTDANKPITLRIRNLDSTPAEFESVRLRVEKVIAANGEGAVNLRPLAPGRYEFFDDFHQQTRGALIVQ